MSMMKMAVTGAVGFALGAGAMLLPQSQKAKKQMQKKLDQWQKMMKM